MPVLHSVYRHRTDDGEIPLTELAAYRQALAWAETVLEDPAAS